MAKSRETIVVVTGDIVKSRLYKGSERLAVQRHLLRSWKVVEKKFAGGLASDLRFRVTAGDEFQYVCKDFETAINGLTLLRILARKSEYRPPITLRACLAVGKRTVRGERDPYTQDGTAFRLAREGIDVLHADRRRLSCVMRENVGDSLSAVNAFLPSLDLIYAGWTRAQAEVLLLHTEGLSGDRIARRLHLDPSTVSKHLRRSGWQEYSDSLPWIVRLVENPHWPK